MQFLPPSHILNLKYFNLQAEKFAQDISYITAQHSERLKQLYASPATQIYELTHTLMEPLLYISSDAPADVAAEIQAAYEQRFY